jgi:hypothetical protein
MHAVSFMGGPYQQIAVRLEDGAHPDSLLAQHAIDHPTALDVLGGRVETVLALLPEAVFLQPFAQQRQPGPSRFSSVWDLEVLSGTPQCPGLLRKPKTSQNDRSYLEECTRYRGAGFSAATPCAQE